MTEIPKGWGRELIFANEQTSGWYCGKLLIFNPHGRCSMHFHLRKKETWYIQSGTFTLRKINPVDAALTISSLLPGDVITNNPGEPHQLLAGPQGGTIFEASSPDYPEDSYRVAKGDSQN